MLEKCNVIHLLALSDIVMDCRISYFHWNHPDFTNNLHHLFILAQSALVQQLSLQRVPHMMQNPLSGILLLTLTL